MTDHDERLVDKVKGALGLGHRRDEVGSGPPEMGVGLDREGTAGTGAHDTGTGLDYDFDERRVTEQGPGAERVVRERREDGR